MYEIYQEELKELEGRAMLRSLKPMEIKGDSICLEGKAMERLSSNDYLALAQDEYFKEKEAELVKQYGLSGSSSSRLLSGNYPIYEAIEQTIAKAFQRESALTFISGYHMNLGIVGALANKQTLILADKLIHASMIDGLKLASAPFERFRHNDLKHLERLIVKHYEEYNQFIVMVESIYSMDGDLADLQGLVALKRRYPKLMLYVDEAHAIGVRGKQGLGLAEETDTIADIDFLVGTFGKALASLGGYIVCNRVIREYLINKCRPLIFSTALPPIRVAFSKMVFERLASLGARREPLTEKSQKLRSLLEELGLKTPSESHIIPIIVGTAERAEAYAKLLQAEGFYVQAIRPPTVAEGSCRLRLSLSSSTDIDKLSIALKKLFSQ